MSISLLRSSPWRSIAPPEDLMREHGVPNRALLVYDEATRRIDGKQDLPPESSRDAATIVRALTALDARAPISPIPAIPHPPSPARPHASRRGSLYRTFDDDEIPF